MGSTHHWHHLPRTGISCISRARALTHTHTHTRRASLAHKMAPQTLSLAYVGYHLHTGCESGAKRVPLVRTGHHHFYTMAITRTQWVTHTQRYHYASLINTGCELHSPGSAHKHWPSLHTLGTTGTTRNKCHSHTSGVTRAQWVSLSHNGYHSHTICTTLTQWVSLSQ